MSIKLPTPRVLSGAVFAGALLLSACGGDAVPIAQAPDAPAAEAQTPAEAPAPANGGISAAIGTTDLGEILVGEGGLTLYGFTNDIDAISACYGTCADAWPPVIVDADFEVAPGLDTGIFATTVRDDGSLQLVAGKWPLYFFAGDAAPGDITGQGSGEVWFAVDTNGVLVTGDAPAEEAAPAADASAGALVSVGTTEVGDVLVDSRGFSLYGFLDDVDGNPTCEGACADAWPPIIVDGPELPGGLDPNVFSVVQRPDGTNQLKAGKWPLYLFAGDAAPGDINGQGSGDVWFLVTPDGSMTGEGSTPAGSPVATGSTEAGDVLVTAQGLSLYGFLDDADGNPTCEGACADAWPPVLLDGPELPEQLDPNVFSVVQRPDGTNQLKAGKWPLYLFAGDAAPGDINGQGSGDTWFLAAPDGSLIGANGVAPASTEQAPADQSSGDDDYGY